MKIILKNFKCYKNKVFDVPDDKFTTIQAESGKGKTSILQSIEYGFFGTIEGEPIKSAKCFIHHNQKEGSVEIQYRNFSIKRPIKKETKNNYSQVKLIIGDRIFESEEAQTKINELLGISKEYFRYSSYIPQKDICMFIRPNSKSQEIFTKYLENMDGVENMQEFLDFFNATQKIQKKKQDELSLEAKEIGGKIKQKEEDCNNIQCEEPKYTLEEIETITISLKQQKKEFQQKQKIQQENNEKRVKFNHISSVLKEQQEMLKKYNYQEVDYNPLKKFKKELNDVEKYIMAMENIEYKKKKLKETIQQKTNIKNVELPELSMEEIIQEEMICNNYKRNLTEYNNIKIPNYVDTTIIKNQLVELQNKLVLVKQNLEVLQCPCCNSKLRLVDNKLIKHDKEDVKENLNELKSQINLTKSKIAEIEIVNQKHEIFSQKKKDLKEKLLEPEYEQYELLEMKNQVRLYQDTQQKLKNINISISQMENEIENTKITKPIMNKEELLLKIQEEENNLHIKEENNRNYKIIVTEIDKMTKQLENLKVENIDTTNYFEKIEDVDDKLSEMTKQTLKRKLYDAFIYEKNTLLNLQIEYKVKNEEITNNQIIIKEIDSIISLSKQTRTQLISNNVVVLNNFMTGFNKKFFDGDMIANIVMNSSNKYSLSVVYKGVDISDNFDIILSGGEYDRLCLSIVLALNNMSNSKFLMLDESISSLDSELTKTILNTIHEECKDKIILVIAHQIESGLFEEKIDL